MARHVAACRGAFCAAWPGRSKRGALSAHPAPIDRLPKGNSVEAKDHDEASGVETVCATFFAGTRFFVTDFTAAFFGTTVAAALLPAAFFGATFVAAALPETFLAPAVFAFFAASLSFAACFSKRAADFAASVAFTTSRFAASMAFFVSARSFSKRFFAAWASRASTLAFFVGAVNVFATGFFLVTALVGVVALVAATMLIYPLSVIRYPLFVIRWSAEYNLWRHLQ